MGSYIDRMSGYCRSCRYDVKRKNRKGACPFNLLYWHFLDRRRPRFENNPRMTQMYRIWDRMDQDKRRIVLREAADFLGRMDWGERV